MFEQSPRPLDGSPLGLDTAAAVRDRPAALPFVLDNFVIVQGWVTTDGEHVAHRRSRGSGRERLAGEAPEADPSREREGLLPDDLDADLAAPRAVELREDDGLEAAEGQLAVVHAHGDGPAEQRGPEM